MQDGIFNTNQKKNFVFPGSQRIPEGTNMVFHPGATLYVLADKLWLKTFSQKIEKTKLQGHPQDMYSDPPNDIRKQAAFGQHLTSKVEIVYIYTVPLDFLRVYGRKVLI